MNLTAIFLTGLLTGGLTCMAVQGGLLAATIANREEERLKEKAKNGNALPIIAFLGAKLIAYTVLGFFLGLLGSVFQLSLPLRTILQIAVAVFMIGTALNLLNAHPIFRYFVVAPPKFLTRLVRNQSKSKDLFAPALLGAFTVFIPCGTTQAMMVLAVGSGKPILGAAILFAFVLGTSPVFFILGYFTTKLGELMQKSFAKVAAFSIILLAIYNLDGAISLTGTPYTLKAAWSNTTCFFTLCNYNAPSQGESATTQDATINILSSQYSPNYITVKKGTPVTLNLTNTAGRGCIQAFTIPALNVQRVVPVGTSDVIKFTAPNSVQDIAFMCSMGMFRGTIHVI